VVIAHDDDDEGSGISGGRFAGRGKQNCPERSVKGPD